MKKENLQLNRGLICTASPRRLWRVRLGDTSRRTRRTAPSRPASDLTFSRTKRVTRAQKPRAPRGVDRPHRELSRPIRSGGSTRRETRPPRQRASFVSPCGLARIQSCTWRKKKKQLSQNLAAAAAREQALPPLPRGCSCFSGGEGTPRGGSLPPFAKATRHQILLFSSSSLHPFLPPAARRFRRDRIGGVV